MRRLKYQRTWTKEPIEVDLLQVDEYGNVKILGTLRTAHTDGMKDMLRGVELTQDNKFHRDIYSEEFNIKDECIWMKEDSINLDELQ